MMPQKPTNNAVHTSFLPWYWVVWARQYGCWTVEDNYGAVWGNFKTPRAACDEVEKMQRAVNRQHTKTMKTFTAQGMEIAECELAAEGLPITQDGAEKFAARIWGKQRKAGGRKYPWRQSIRSASGQVL